MDSGFPWWILIVVVFFGIFVYLMLMLFLPEWVGITGKTALENEKSHREGSDAYEPTPKGRTRRPLPPAVDPTVGPSVTLETTQPPTDVPAEVRPKLTLVRKTDEGSGGGSESGSDSQN